MAPTHSLSDAVLSLFSFKLSDEILKPVDSSCLRDNECQTTCCHTELCSLVDACQESRKLVVTIFTVACFLILIGGIVAYCVYFKKRRETRYDERLNSIHSMSHNGQANLINRAIN